MVRSPMTSALVALAVIAPLSLAACSGSAASNSPPSVSTASQASSLMASYEQDSLAKAEAMPLMSQINGQVPPGTPTLVATSTEILNVMRDGQQVRVFRDIRDPGTRAPIHVHAFGGWTCVVSGEAILYMEGADPVTAKAGDCMDMPALTPMSNANPGTVPSVLLDTFATPPDAPIWRIVEKGETQLGNEFATGPSTKANP